MRTRGTGSVFQSSYRDRYGRKRKSRTWSIGFYADGRFVRENTGKTRKSEAERILRRRLLEVEEGHATGSSDRRTRYEELAQLIRDDYASNALRSADRLERSLSHLSRAFADKRVTAITTAAIHSYKADRLREGAGTATVNRELAALRRMFHWGVRLGKVSRAPAIDTLKEPPARAGFFQREELNDVLPHLTPDLRPVVQTALTTGWRG